MPAPNPSAMSQGLPPGLGEAFDESSISQALGSSQQNASSSSSTSQTALQNQLAQQMGSQSQQQKPREVGSLKDELIVRPAKDIVKGIASFFDIKSILGINPQTDTPEEQMKKKQMHQRFQQLTQEEQQVAQQRYQKEMERKQRMEQEAQIARQKKAQEEANSIAPPSSPRKGAGGKGGSSKQRVEDKLEQDRKTLNGPMAVD